MLWWPRMSPAAPMLLLLCVFAQACQPEAERRETRLVTPISIAPTTPVRVSEWVAALGAPEAQGTQPTRSAQPSFEDAVTPPPEVLAAAVEAGAGPPDEVAELAPTPTGPALDPPPEPVADPPAAEPAAEAPAARPTSAVGPTPPPEVLLAVARSPSRDELEEARRLNKNGLGKHRKGEMAAAIADYEAALAVAPSHVFSRYNLACALALTDQHVEALMHLAVIAHQAEQDRPARERLGAARIDKDFEHLRSNPRFRELTLATQILVTWPADGPGPAADREEARAVHKALRDARWDGQLARAPWRGEAASATLMVRAGADPVDLSAARAILDELELSFPGRFGLELDAALPSGGPPLVLLVSPLAAKTRADPPLPEPTPEPADQLEPETSPEAPKTLGEQLDPLLGRRLGATGGGVVEHLELRATGFFSWERREGKSRIERQGRWALTQDGLALSYSERVTEGDPPTLVVNDGQSSTHRVSVSGRTLHLDGRLFR